MPPRSAPVVPRLAAALLVAAFCAAGVAEDVAPIGAPAGGFSDAALDADVARRVTDPAALPLDVFLILRDQPAREVARTQRAVYGARVEAAWQPVREALARIEPLLANRAERERTPIGRQIADENALLRPDEREARWAARREVARLLAEMRATIMAEAWARCAPVQERIADHVESLPEGRVLARTAVLNALVVRVRPADLPSILRVNPEIARVAMSGVRETSMDVSVPVIGAADWTDNSIDGSGQKVAIVDTGVDDAHPALEYSDGTSVVTASAVRLSNAASQSNFDDDDADTDDLHGHGTHIAGTIASQDSTYGGVAPGAPLMNAKCFYRTSSGGGSGLDPDIIAATDWALSNGASVLSLSFGGGGDVDGTQALSRFYDAVVGVTGASVAVAAGNSGAGASTVLSPGDAFNALTVGAFDDRGSVATSGDIIAGFSSRGPTDDDRRKPDLAAPGVSIRSAHNTWEGSGADFVTKSGTSMATPHVAAAMALLLDHESSWQAEAVKALLVNSVRNTSPAPTTPDQAWGYGALDLAAAYTERDRVESATLTSSGVDKLYFALTNVASGDRATLVWNRDVGFASGGRSAGAGSAKSLVDLDLFLYGDDGAEDAASESGDDPVEQVKATAALGDSVLKIERVGTFPGGQTSLDVAVASSAAIAPADPPELVVSVSAPTDVAGAAQFTLTATTQNSGGLPAIAPDVTLTLPTGWSLAAGASSATQTLGDIAADGQATVSWQVSAPAVTGTGTLAVDASSDAWGETFSAARATTDVRADATPPTVEAGPDQALFASSPVGRTVVLRATATDDSGASVHFVWDTDGDGDFTDDPGSTGDQEPTLLLAIGAHDVGVRGVDHVGNTATDEMTLTILDNPPDAVAGADVAVFEGTAVALDASGSSDVEGALTYAWDLGDGVTLSGASVSHAYGDQGTYDVTLRVTDGALQTASDTLTVTVANADPVAAAGPDREIGEGRTIVVSGAGSDPGASDSLTYAWDLGDGATASTAVVAHVYREDGTYTATLTVTDDDGASASDSVVIEVRNLPPEVETLPPMAIDEGDSVLLTGSATDPGVDDTLTFAWNIDGIVLPGAAVSHTFDRDGSRRAFLSVTDDDGATGFGSVFVEVRNVPPTLSIPAELSVGIGASIVHDLEPHDASPLDEASLGVSWRIVAPGPDGEPLVLAEGSGPLVRFDAVSRLTNGTLVATVADDDVRVEYSAEVRAVTPALADALGPLLRADLDPPLEKRVLAAVLAADGVARPGVKKSALKRALRSVRRARKALLRAGSPDVGGADLALGAIEEDLAAGTPPPRPAVLLLPDVADLRDVIAALPGAGLGVVTSRRLSKALLKLRAAERRQKPDAKLRKLRAKVARVAAGLPSGDPFARAVVALLATE